MSIPSLHVDPFILAGIRRALEEDIGGGDVTTQSLVPESAMGSAAIVSRGDYIVSGGDVVRAVFRELDEDLVVEVVRADGRGVNKGDVIMRLEGRARAILTGERTALNYLQRMTGIATETRGYVNKAQKYGVAILDTRKTVPGLRSLDKYAVLCGGGVNHRMGLHDRIMIKDNHLAFEATQDSGGLSGAVLKARNAYPDLLIEVEVDRIDQLREVLPSRPDWVLLDNMTPHQVRECAQVCKGLCKVEVSGGVTRETLESYLATGIDAISIGGLTHSVRAADLSLEWK